MFLLFVFLCVGGCNESSKNEHSTEMVSSRGDKHNFSSLDLENEEMQKEPRGYMEAMHKVICYNGYYDYNNVDIFPNFRFFDFTPSRKSATKLRVVFMARINKKKGLDWIFEFAEYITKNNLIDKFSLTFYGPIKDDDREYFETMLNKFPFVRYEGILQPDEIYDALNEQDVLILPTHYYTEGLPGSIVDAYISGIPVWNDDDDAEEFVEDAKTGYVVPFDGGEQQFIESLLALESDRELLCTLQCNALEKRQEFAPPMFNI